MMISDNESFYTYNNEIYYIDDKKLVNRSVDFFGQEVPYDLGPIVEVFYMDDEFIVYGNGSDILCYYIENEEKE